MSTLNKHVSHYFNILALFNLKGISHHQNKINSASAAPQQSKFLDLKGISHHQNNFHSTSAAPQQAKYPHTQTTRDTWW